MSKFSKASIFSGLNNLQDISLNARFNTLLGYTKHEIEMYFGDFLRNMAQYINSLAEELLEKLTEWYDGYLFSRNESADRLYNQFSVLLCLEKGEFFNYWFEI